MAEPLKQMYNTTFITDLAYALALDPAELCSRVFDDQWEARELKARMRHITHCLAALLPDDYTAALARLRDGAPRLSAYRYETMVFPDFVGVYGLDHWEDSIAALEQFTEQSSGEFAIRSFLTRDLERGMRQMRLWADHPNVHVRRLASEGCRPRLPWASALPMLKRDPTPILPILEALRHDPAEYVRRSVANNLNDIAKDHAQVVIDQLRAWQTEAHPAIAWITHHSLRSLIKSGNPDALRLIGAEHGAPITVDDLRLTPETIAIGESIVCSCRITAQEACDVVIDYAIGFQKKNGTLAPKVFKWTRKTLNAGESITLRKQHSFRLISTRVYYPGEHQWAIQVNGVTMARIEFNLKPSIDSAVLPIT
jgi:3-methyladenine DNA glycosylase AlkC